MTGVVGQIYRCAVEEDGAVYHFHDPELIPVGLILKSRRKKVVYDIHEDLARQILSKDWIPGCARRVVAFVSQVCEGIAGRFLDGIVAATPSIGQRFPPHKTVVVRNYPIIGELDGTGHSSYAARPMNLAYVGVITGLRGVREMVEAVGLLPENLGVHLDMAGWFDPPALEDELRAAPGWERVRHAVWLDRPQVAELLDKARAGFVLFHPEPNHISALPNKLFEYMSAGIPVIVSDFALWRGIVEQAKCGLVVNPKDARAVADAAFWLLTHPDEAAQMGERGREAVLREYNWDRESSKLVSLYERLVR
ncbi:MAG: glycosyltransferase family 4 protein [Ignavibacteriales bacterium]